MTPSTDSKAQQEQPAIDGSLALSGLNGDDSSKVDVEAPASNHPTKHVALPAELVHRAAAFGSRFSVWNYAYAAYALN